MAIFSLPTTPITWVANAIATAAQFNTGLRDMLNAIATQLNAPTRPGCRAVRTASQSLASTTYTAIVLSAADDYDPDAMHDPGGANPERVTITEPGKYIIFGHVLFQGSGPDRVYIKLRKNTAGAYTDMAEQSQRALGSSVQTDVCIGTEYNLAAGDHVELWARQDDDDVSASANVLEAELTVRWQTSN